MKHILAITLSLSMMPLLSSAQEKAGTTLFRAFGSMFQAKKEVCEEANERPPMPQSTVTSPDAAITPTGKVLTPFGGQPHYKGPQLPPQQNVEEELAMLPPMPDLRTPDQITKAERKRNYRNAKAAARQAKNEALREERQAAAMAKVNTPAPDPSTALIQVESRKGDAVDHGNRERPVGVQGSSLKPFNGESTYYDGSELKFQWSNHEFVEPRKDNSDELGILPPLPDLRTPDQITKQERMRNLRNLKFRARQIQQKEMRERNKAALLPYQ